jgi:hypothetical protein
VSPFVKSVAARATRGAAIGNQLAAVRVFFGLRVAGCCGEADAHQQQNTHCQGAHGQSPALDMVVQSQEQRTVVMPPPMSETRRDVTTYFTLESLALKRRLDGGVDATFRFRWGLSAR